MSGPREGRPAANRAANVSDNNLDESRIPPASIPRLPIAVPISKLNLRICDVPHITCALCFTDTSPWSCSCGSTRMVNLTATLTGPVES